MTDCSFLFWTTATRPLLVVCFTAQYRGSTGLSSFRDGSSEDSMMEPDSDVGALLQNPAVQIHIIQNAWLYSRQVSPSDATLDSNEVRLNLVTCWWSLGSAVPSSRAGLAMSYDISYEDLEAGRARRRLILPKTHCAGYELL